MSNHRLTARATKAIRRGAQTRVAGITRDEAGAWLSSWSGVVEADMASLWHRRAGFQDEVQRQGSRLASKALRSFANTPRRCHKRCLWRLGGNWMGFEEDEEQPGRERQNAPPVQHDVHVPVAVEVTDPKGMQLPGPQFLLHGIGGQDGNPDAPQDGLLDGLVAAEFQGDPKVRQGESHLVQGLLETVAQPRADFPQDEGMARKMIHRNLY